MNAGTSLRIGFVVAALAVAGWRLWNSGDARRINYGPYQALGDVAGAEVSQLLGGQGKVVLVRADPGEDPDPVLDAQIAAFRRGLGAAGKVNLAGIDLVTMDGFVRMRTGGAMPPEHFAELRQKYPDADALVFFLGFPMLPAEDLEKAKSGKPRLIVVSAVLPWYTSLVNQGAIQLAIVPRDTADAAELGGTKAGESGSAGTREVFDREYRILKPEAK